MNDRCELCGLETKLTKHHLVPQVKSHSAKYSKSLKTDESNFLWVCDPCHKKIHATFTENELRDFYKTKEEILASDEISSFIKWRRKHPEFNGSSKMSNDRKKRR